MKDKRHIQSFNEHQENLNISDVSGSFYGIGQMCKRCSGDGWVFHSKGGQSGLMKDCPRCDGKGVIKNYH
jgi:DnaJ-class molecular chaperone